MVRENFLLRFRTPNMEISKHSLTPQHIQLQIKETHIDYSIVLALCDLFLLSERCLCWMLQNLNRICNVITIRLCPYCNDLYCFSAKLFTFFDYQQRFGVDFVHHCKLRSTGLQVLFDTHYLQFHPLLLQST